MCKFIKSSESVKCVFPRIFFGVGVLLFCVYVLLFNLSQEESLKNYTSAWKVLKNKFKSTLELTVDKVNKKSKDYVLETTKLLVNTSSCQIPDFKPGDPVRDPRAFANCSNSTYSWAIVEDNKYLVFNTSKILKAGYSFEKISCCYMIIRRVQQSIHGFTKDADNLVSFSECISLTNVKTDISSEFIIVQCSLEGPENVIYQGFHATAQLQGSQKIQKKTEYWKKPRTNRQLPPNILMLGLDSTSRLTFRRNMPKTLRFLQNLGAVEMLGYTKVGENTLPNIGAVLNGYSYDEMQRICFSPSDNLYDCPTWSWRRFEDANYLTSFIEDLPAGAIFNYWGTGFVQQPADFYLRPIFMAAHEYGLPYKTVLKNFSAHADCIGHQSNDEMITTYVESVMDLAVANRAPVFSLSWSTALSHDDSNLIFLADDTYAQLLERLKNKGYMNNTILIFMGDHGDRFGARRETLAGYYEDRLPNMWISLPLWIKTKFPDWQKALEFNSRQLTSPFTMYWTIDKILRTFTNVTDPPPDAIDRNTQEDISRKHIQSFFDFIPKEKCEDVGVPEACCACNSLENVQLNDTYLKKASVLAVTYINKKLIAECVDLKVAKILQGGLKEMLEEKLIYIVTFVTTPGDFVFEAEVNYFRRNSSFGKNPVVQRVNKVNSNFVTCLTSRTLELFCYCRP